MKNYREMFSNKAPAARSTVYKVSFTHPQFFAETYDETTDTFGSVPVDGRNVTEVRKMLESVMVGDTVWPFVGEGDPTGYVIDNGDVTVNVYYVPRADFIKYGRSESAKGDRGRTVEQTVITGKAAGTTVTDTVKGEYTTPAAVYRDFGRKYGHVVNLEYFSGKRWMNEVEVARYAVPLKTEDKAAEDITAPDDMDGNAPAPAEG